ncbi:MAG: DUF465 domain-containing protein [Thermodesulfovibrionales bacterium]|nr:DUF465 domain-containing protein [Thermodesulfovibrionales bacterium]
MKENEIVETLKKENEEFRKLSEEHRNLDTQLAEMDTKRYLSPEEELERKRIQKLKLSRKDRMAELVSEYKKTNVTN